MTGHAHSSVLSVFCSCSRRRWHLKRLLLVLLHYCVCRIQHNTGVPSSSINVKLSNGARSWWRIPAREKFQIPGMNIKQHKVGACKVVGRCCCCCYYYGSPCRGGTLKLNSDKHRRNAGNKYIIIGSRVGGGGLISSNKQQQPTYVGFVYRALGESIDYDDDPLSDGEASGGRWW